MQSVTFYDNSGGEARVWVPKEGPVLTHQDVRNAVLDLLLEGLGINLVPVTESAYTYKVLVDGGATGNTQQFLKQLHAEDDNEYDDVVVGGRPRTRTARRPRTRRNRTKRRRPTSRRGK